MDKRFRKYLEEQGMKPLDPEIVAEYHKTMVETVVPEIIESIKQRERHAMELRFLPFAPSDPKGRGD